MRALQTKDVFSCVRLVKKLNLKGAIKEFQANVDTKQSDEAIGIDLMFTIFEAVATEEGEKEIYKFLSGPLEMKPEEVEVLDPMELIENLKKVADFKKWSDFLKQAFK